MARLFYGHVQTNGAKIHYYRTGDEKPSVVFLHGFSDNGLCWSRLALRLEPFYDVILVDARAHGLSSAPEQGYSPEDRAADVAGLIHSLQLATPPIVGHSMGAETAVMTAALYPKLVGSLILEDPPFWETPKKESLDAREQRAEKFRKQIMDWRGKPLAELIETGKRLYPNWEEVDLFQWGKAKQQVRPISVEAIAQDRPDWRTYARQVKCPALLITADPRLGAIVTSEIAKEVTRMWRKSQVVEIPDAGHNIRREQFESYYDAIKLFLRKNTRW